VSKGVKIKHLDPLHHFSHDFTALTFSKIITPLSAPFYLCWMYKSYNPLVQN